jgi:hypothetical protein
LYLGLSEETVPRTDTGGSAAAGGFDYQHRVTAWFAARMLAGTAASGVRGLYQGEILEIACETNDPVDDCRITLADNVLALQAKHSINLGKAEDSEIAKTAGQFVRQHLMPGHNADRLILVTTSYASGNVTQHLRGALERFRKLPEPSFPLSSSRDEREALATFLDHVRREWRRYLQLATEPTQEQLRAFLRHCWAWTLDVGHGMPAEREALDVLRSSVLSDPGQADSAWDSLLRISAQAAADKTGFDRHQLEHELRSTCGIGLIGGYQAHATTTRFREVLDWDAEQLNIHSAVSGQRPGAQDGFVLPAYVPRPHDKSIRDRLERLAAESETRLLLLRGGSCTGKTRTAYEAVRAALPDWRLAYPKTAEALLVLLNGPSVAARSVLWLDDLHQMLNEPAGEQAAALLRDLLHKPGPVALIATAWPDACQELTTTPDSEHPDRHYQARMLLREAWIRDIPNKFVGADYQEFERRAVGDASLTAAMRAASSAGEVTQTLAAAPELMEHWLHAPAPYGKAVITAAVDARRLGVRAGLPDVFLEAAASGFFAPAERARAQPNWFDEALDYARQPVKRVTSALLPVARPTGMGALPGVSDLADYLEQHGAALRWDQVPPAAFWAAALDYLPSGDDLERLAINAFSRGRFHLSRDLNLLALRKGCADAFEGLCFSYIETGRILTQQGRDELVSVVRDAEDGGYSLWYLGSTLWSIHGEPGDGGDEALFLAGELLVESYQAGYLNAAHVLAELCAAIGVDATGLVADALQKEEAERAASPSQNTAHDWWDSQVVPTDADGSVTPSELLSLLAEHTVDDHVVTASVLQWWQERPEETRDLLDFCGRSYRASAAIGAARTLLKLHEPAARPMAEEVLIRLADDGHSGAQMMLARWRLNQWQEGDPASDEALPQDIRLLLEKAAANRTEARRLLGQDARRRGDTAEAERLFRDALDGGDYTVLRELAEVLNPGSPEGARQLELSGLDANGSPCPPW